MIYGLYLSATGVLTNAHRQDVIANNLANAETVGFKRDLAVFQEIRTAASQRGLNPSRHSDPLLEPLGGGLTYAPTFVDYSQGELESDGDPFSMAIEGSGFFAVLDDGQVRLTRNGQFSVNQRGNLALASGGQEVLDTQMRPIPLAATGGLTLMADGTLVQSGQAVARLGVFDVPDPARLKKLGSSLMSYPQIERSVRAASGQVRQGVIERGNVDPTIELARMMDAQRQLEANANIIRFQDQTLGRLVNDVGRIG
jgi:flagellar basal body rod protein FlgG